VHTTCLKLLPLDSDMTFDGWVSENYLALVQILPWVMLPVRSWEEVTEYRDPDGSPKDWTRSQLREFLRQRGIKVRGKKNQNRLDVLEVTKKRPRDQPKILYLGNASPGLICDLLHCLHVMISCLMDTKVRRDDSSH
jgi:hypothetical protein